MAILETSRVRWLVLGMVLPSSACTVFNGLAVPSVDAGVSCDPNANTSASNNCGACGHDCLGGACVNGICQPQILAQATGVPTDIQLDEQFVYFTTSDGIVGRVSKSGSDQRAIVYGITGGLDRLASFSPPNSPGSFTPPPKTDRTRRPLRRTNPMRMALRRMVKRCTGPLTRARTSVGLGKLPYIPTAAST